MGQVRHMGIYVWECAPGKFLFYHLHNHPRVEGGGGGRYSINTGSHFEVQHPGNSRHQLLYPLGKGCYKILQLWQCVIWGEETKSSKELQMSRGEQDMNCEIIIT